MSRNRLHDSSGVDGSGRASDPDGARITLDDLPARADGYVDLRSYAAIGDTRTIALVAYDGSIDWLPIPALDDTPVFARLLDAERGGSITLHPVEEFSTSREYIPGTNVLCTTFTTERGSVQVTDALNIGLTGPLPWTELARRVDGVEGTVPMRFSVTAGTGLGVGSPWTEETDHGTVLHLRGVTMGVVTAGLEQQCVTDRSVTGEFTTAEGSTHLVAVSATSREPLHMPTADAVRKGIEATIEYWTKWSDRLSYDGPWSDEILRSALMLRLLTNSESGAIAAAATTSLPESWSGDKNWDYRYAWVRDAAYTLHALLAFGEREEAHAAVSWLLRMLRRQGAQLQVFATLDGDRPAVEQHLRAPGWRGIGPVVTGNRAVDQLQLSVYGDLFDLVHHYVDGGHLLDAEAAEMLGHFADDVCDLWQRPDAGVWELVEERHYTSSKMGCWKALDCAVSLAENGHLSGSVNRWRRERDRIRAWIDEHCWSEKLGAYTWYPGTDALDASVLVYAIKGYDRGERMSTTIDAMLRELGDGPLIYRFSGADDEEGAFVACTFWAVAALVDVGRHDEAESLMGRAVPLANDVGLFAEMIETDSHAFLGNLPQGLSHLAVMAAALNLIGEYDAKDTP